MKKILLDSNIILQTPEILSRRIDGVEFIIPEPVLNELIGASSVGFFSEYYSLLEKAQAVGNIKIQYINTEELITRLQSGPFYYALSIVDRQLVAYAKKIILDNPTDEILLATNDKQLAKSAEILDIRTVDSSYIHSQLLQTGHTDATIGAEVRKVNKNQRLKVIFGFLFGVFFTFIANVIYSNLDVIVLTFRYWGTIAAIFFVAFFMFWTRARFRFVYGVTEFGVGFVAAIRVFGSSFDYSALNAIPILQLMGGLYIMVRGLDNVSKGLKGKSFWPTWSRWFPE